MPRNASATKRKKKASIDAEERYARESLHKRTICYHFWNFIDIDGKKGDLWNPVKTPGSVYNRRSSAYLVNTIPERSFDKIAKSMASLAQELAARGIRLEDPYKQHKKKAQDLGVPFEDLEEAEDHQYSDDEEVETDIEEEEEEIPKQVSFSPPLSARKMPPKKAASPATSSAMKHKAPRTKHAAITGLLGAPITNGIAAPIVKGEFMSRCIKTRKRFNHYHIRMLSHNYVTADDILYEWIDKHTLKVVVYDPPWWSDPEYQAAFDALHGKGSNLIESMIDFQEERKEKVPGQDEKRTGNTGYFTFGEPMSIKEEDDTVVVPQKILHNAIDGC
ncbi:hypothetical protein FRACYDRAFT_250691 [Fragilariopsis cylindrus CCMP1102]|uniref:Uncharacterized protein n=1 Tax=Fragilariopsis cylindrus CCMP1102 TaxID=635003 RepID=A0A1E7ENX4_9STRA|nr:hypothetical protein FRACYDRAFT_250691 [Fragilariopsis cylindrus CCMP1102]|eukprot:OEU07672.1 hypothetical protein FRACYDRAFT_250691 [Fragilariopsis cylindrus CCMP1102]